MSPWAMVAGEASPTAAKQRGGVCVEGPHLTPGLGLHPTFHCAWSSRCTCTHTQHADVFSFADL